jgi:hypothetical protein
LYLTPQFGQSKRPISGFATSLSRHVGLQS